MFKNRNYSLTILNNTTGKAGFTGRIVNLIINVF